MKGDDIWTKAGDDIRAAYKARAARASKGEKSCDKMYAAYLARKQDETMDSEQAITASSTSTSSPIMTPATLAKDVSARSGAETDEHLSEVISLSRQDCRNLVNHFQTRESERQQDHRRILDLESRLKGLEPLQPRSQHLPFLRPVAPGNPTHGSPSDVTINAINARIAREIQRQVRRLPVQSRRQPTTK